MGKSRRHVKFVGTALVAFCIACGWGDIAFAGAWTLPAGDTQIISGAILSSAAESFDDTGGTVPTYYRKILLQSYAEHGLTNDLTLVLAPEYAIATEGGPDRPTIHADDFAFKAGARYLLTDTFGVLSVQASYKTAGAFDMSVSANRDSGSETELRLLYGANFELFHKDAYFDAEIAQRWISGARPNEVPIDLTLGVHWSEKFTFMVQSFDIVASGNGEPPYRYYRSHKVELAILQRLWKGVYLESGAYLSPTGQNSLVERGADASIWVYF
jgi:protein XagA